MSVAGTRCKSSPNEVNIYSLQGGVNLSKINFYCWRTDCLFVTLFSAIFMLFMCFITPPHAVFKWASKVCKINK